MIHDQETLQEIKNDFQLILLVDLKWNWERQLDRSSVVPDSNIIQWLKKLVLVVSKLWWILSTQWIGGYSLNIQVQ